MLERSHKHTRTALKRLVFLSVLLLAAPALACNFSSAAGLVTPSGVASLAAPSPAVIASPTSQPATQPPATQPPVMPTAPAKTQAPPATLVQATVMPELQTVKIFLVATGDNGASGKLIGCGDSLVPVTQQIVPTQGVLRAALEILLGIRQQYYGQSGLYNALYQSELTIEDLRIENGKASLRLAGRLLLGGVCDNPRLEAQLVETALQFSTVQQVEIFINGKPLKDLLSEK
jgi:hypothetical protein